MEQKGMSATAIAVIVIVVVGGVGGAVYFLVLAPGAPFGGEGPGPETTGIAAYPGSTKASSVGGSSASSFLSSMSAMGGGEHVSEAEIAGISIDIYTCTDSVTNIINWYKSKWQSEGYTENFSETFDFSEIPGAEYYGLSGSIGIALYEKGDQMVGVVAMTYQNETYYILFAASKSTLEELAESYGSWSY